MEVLGHGVCGVFSVSFIAKCASFACTESLLCCMALPALGPFVFLILLASWV